MHDHQNRTLAVPRTRTRTSSRLRQASAHANADVHLENSQKTPCDSQSRQAGLERGPEGLLIYHGPTSIFQQQGTDAPVINQMASQGIVPVAMETDYGHVAAYFGIDLQDDLISSAMMQFFRWQYPHFMFIYREAFLRDHFGDRHASKYWSLPLLLAVCALGALMSPDIHQRRMSEQFFNAAESIIIVSGLTQPSVTTVQVFLCLAFYEIDRGNLSKGWGFSGRSKCNNDTEELGKILIGTLGIAFRMAQDLGFQRDPRYWVARDATIATPEDIEIRRRIYWGCYTSDKIISLVLGRPVQLYGDDAEVGRTERLP